MTRIHRWYCWKIDTGAYSESYGIKSAKEESLQTQFCQGARLKPVLGFMLSLIYDDLTAPIYVVVAFVAFVLIIVSSVGDYTARLSSSQ